MRISRATVALNIATNECGDITCIRALSGHPIILSAAIESVQSWKFKPTVIRGQPVPVYGKLVLKISGTERGLRTRILAGTE